VPDSKSAAALNELGPFVVVSENVAPAGCHIPTIATRRKQATANAMSTRRDDSTHRTHLSLSPRPQFTCSLIGRRTPELTYGTSSSRGPLEEQTAPSGSRASLSSSGSSSSTMSARASRSHFSAPT
jgi:hypothetical protein